MKIAVSAVVLAACLAQPCLARQIAVPAKKRVLLLLSHHALAPINADWIRGIRFGLAESLPVGIQIDIEHLDLENNISEEYRQEWLALLKRKYTNLQPDLVIPVYTHAFRFVLEHRDELFPDVPIVYCSINHQFADRVRGEPDITGVTFQLGFRETVDVAWDLFPNVNRLLVVAGKANDNNMMLQFARQVLEGYDEELEIEYIVGLSRPELVERMKEISPNSMVLMLAVNQENRGTEYFTTEVVEQISKVCPAPVFGLYDTLLGYGIVGGWLASAETQGNMAGDMAIRILKGEAPADIPVAGLDTNQYEFDARQLERWGIKKSALPSDALVRFEELTMWERYGAYFMVGLVLLIFQSVVIVGMLVNRSRRLNAERSLSVSRDDAKQLAGRLITAQEDERKRLARELHDDLSQRIAAMAIEADKLALLPDPSPDVQDRLGDLTKQLISLSDDLHRISHQIHPAILDDLGLRDALQSECDRFAKRESIAIEFQCGTFPEGLGDSVSLCLYRIAQESLWNASRYAKADRVDVMLTADAEAVYLSVTDSGIGFDPAGIARNSGLGLASMRERVGLVNGSLSIDSLPGSGTTIAATVPLVEEG